MKRIDNIWWKGNDGYYKEVDKRVWEGPFESMQQQRVVTLDEVVELKPIETLKEEE
jgi:hypothetical protein